MVERYKLVFRGEVLEGQHPAVVRKRLGEAGSFDDAQLDKLFSGKAVVVKREAGKDAAERLQALFSGAGARLRLVALEGEAQSAPDRAAGVSVVAGEPSAADAPDAPAWEVLPPGSDVLRSEERVAPQGSAVAAGEFTVAEVGADLLPQRRATEVSPPDVSHLKLVDES